MTQPTVAPEALAGMIQRKAEESASVKTRFFAEQAAMIVECSQRMAEAFGQGGRLFVMGNGGSACDAQHLALEFMHPIFEKRPALPAMALATDAALLTALGNDQDFSLAFASQLRLLARPGDMALGLSTSGQSANVLRALKAARELGLVTIGFAGRDGGRLAAACDFCFTVPSFSTHRIQEVHQTLVHVLWDMVHVQRGEEDVL